MADDDTASDEVRRRFQPATALLLDPDDPTYGGVEAGSIEQAKRNFMAFSGDQQTQDPLIQVNQKRNLSPQSPDIAQLPSVTPPNLQNMPDPSQYGMGPQQHQESPFKVFFNPMVLLGAASSLLTRKPLMAAMSYATGAMNGIRQGQQDVFDQNQVKFRDALGQAVAQNKVEIDRYNAAWDQRSQLTSENTARLYAASAQNNDPAMQAAIRAQNWPLVEKMMLMKQQAQDQVQRAVEVQEAKEREKDAEIERLKQTPRVQRQADEIINYRQPMPPAYRQSPELTAIRDLVNERSAGTGKEFQQTGFGERNKAAQVMASGNGQGARIISLNTTIRHFRTLDRLADALGNGDFNTFNQWRQTIAEQRGQPDVTNYDLAADIVSKEIVKSLVANGGGQTERSEIEQQFSHGHSPQQLHGLVQTGRELLGSQFQSLKKWAEAHYAGDVFDRSIEPEARAALQAGEAKVGGRPAPGLVKDGYRYMGGDPGNPKSWEIE